MSEPINCPCGSGQNYAQCCEPCHNDIRPATTAEALMRSRFSAYVVGDSAYLLKTWHPSTRPEQLNLSDQPHWERLEIISTQAGAAEDTQGQVEFAAHYRTAEGPGCLHELSEFRKETGCWLYLKGTQPAQANPGRNASCPCGSGKKYKRCCGR